MLAIVKWSELVSSDEYKGRWVALDQCRYDAAAKPIEGTLVDADEDLVELCNRIRSKGSHNCAILYIDEPPASVRGPQSSRALH